MVKTYHYKRLCSLCRISSFLVSQNHVRTAVTHLHSYLHCVLKMLNWRTEVKQKTISNAKCILLIERIGLDNRVESNLWKYSFV